MIDYRELLHKYMEHVACCEGIDFTDRIHDSWSGSPVEFTDEEVAYLKRLSDSEEKVA